MNERTPGQIAYEAWAEWQGWTKIRRLSWEHASPSDRAKFNFIGQKVAQAVAPVPDPDYDPATENPV
jgi:hypothetical protein